MLVKRTAYLDILVCLLAVAFCIFRLFYGADFTDEGYYVALPWRFVLGDRPFINENYLLQSAAVPLIPLIKTFTFFTGGNEGILLFTRFIYLLLALTTSLIAWLCLKIKWPRFPFAACLLLAVYIPYNNPGLSYNTLGRFFLIMGLFLGLFRLYLAKASPYLFAAGILHGLAVFSYPTLLVSVLAFLIALFVCSGVKPLRLCFIYLGGFLLPLLVIFLLLDAKIPDYVHTLNFTRSAVQKISAVGSTSHVLDVLQEGKNALPPLLAILLIPLFLFISSKQKPVFFLSVVFYILAISIYFARPSLGGAGASGTTTNLGLLFIFLLLFWKPLPESLKHFSWLVLIPAFVGGLAMANTSGNSWHAGALLFSVGLVFGLLVIYERINFRKEFWVVFFSSIISIVLLKYQLTAMPDGQRQDLTVQLSKGPYRGIYTSPEKESYYNELMSLLSKYENETGNILFYPHFPAAYLFTHMRPATPSVWGECQPESISICQDYFSKTFSAESVTIRVKELLVTKNNRITVAKDQDPFDAYISSKQMVLEETEHFILYGKK